MIWALNWYRASESGPVTTQIFAEIEAILQPDYYSVIDQQYTATIEPEHTVIMQEEHIAYIELDMVGELSE